MDRNPARTNIACSASAHSHVRGEKSNAYIALQLLERIEALYKHFEIDPKASGAEMSLIIKLACQLDIPGFRVKSSYPVKKIGAPSKWTGTASFILYADIHEIMRKENCSARQAAIKHRSGGSKGLYNRYQEFRKRLGKKGCMNLDLILGCENSDFQSLKSLFLESKTEDGDAFLNNPECLDFVARLAGS
jgi:hypothetical protein